MRGTLSTAVLAGLFAMPMVGPALADEPVVVTLKNHQFTPSEIHVPAGKRMDLLVKNADSTADEFDSDDLHVEKVIGGGQSGTIHLPKLDKGRYKFEGEFHAATAKGVVVAE